jgi:hypothetical protein
VLLLLGLLVFQGTANGGARLMVLLLLAVLLVVEVVLYAQASRSAPPAAAQPGGEPLQAAPQEQRIVIRCKQCGEVFPVEDTGARPLVAACPHCGKSGTIKVKHDVA